MVPPSSHRVPRVRRYSGSCWLPCRFAYGILTLFDRPSHAVPLQLRIPSAVQTPRIFLPAVWPLPLSLTTTHGISVDFSSSPYLDVSVQAVPLIRLWIQRMIHRHDSVWIAPFGNPRISACLQLPVAYRRSLRPSSAPSAKASALRPFSLDLYSGAFRLLPNSL